MRQSWRDLLFLHFPCDPEEVQALLPEGLKVDTFPDESGAERAWIGLVPFLMTGIRWSFAPSVPGTHTFPETNVRTYVHCGGRDPGVWFFSLDAANRLAVSVARSAFGLPYHLSSMSLQRTDEAIRYTGSRRGVEYQIDAQIGKDMGPAEAGSLEFFLIERYLLYSARAPGLWSGRVHHAPYRLREARVSSIESSLVQAAGLAARPFTHAVFAERADVDVFPLRRIALK